MDLAAIVVAVVGLVGIVFSVLGDEIQQRWVRISMAVLGAVLLAGSIYNFHFP